MNAHFSRNFANRWQYAGHPPDGLVPYKGSVHVVVNRNFVDFAIRNQSSFRLLHWLNRTEFPDETFFTTLNHNSKLHIPGSFKGILHAKLHIPGFFKGILHSITF